MVVPLGGDSVCVDRAGQIDRQAVEDGRGAARVERQVADAMRRQAGAGWPVPVPGGCRRHGASPPGRRGAIREAGPACCRVSRLNVPLVDGRSGSLLRGVATGGCAEPRVSTVLKCTKAHLLRKFLGTRRSTIFPTGRAWPTNPIAKASRSRKAGKVLRPLSGFSGFLPTICPGNFPENSEFFRNFRAPSTVGAHYSAEKGRAPWKPRYRVPSVVSPSD